MGVEGEGHHGAQERGAAHRGRFGQGQRAVAGPEHEQRAQGVRARLAAEVDGKRRQGEHRPRGPRRLRPAETARDASEQRQVQHGGDEREIADREIEMPGAPEGSQHHFGQQVVDRRVALLPEGHEQLLQAAPGQGDGEDLVEPQRARVDEEQPGQQAHPDRNQAGLDLPSAHLLAHHEAGILSSPSATIEGWTCGGVSGRGARGASAESRSHWSPSPSRWSGWRSARRRAAVYARGAGAPDQTTSAESRPVAEWTDRFTSLLASRDWEALDAELEGIREREPDLYAWYRLGYLHGRVKLARGEHAEARRMLEPFLAAGHPLRDLALHYAAAAEDGGGQRRGGRAPPRGPHPQPSPGQLSPARARGPRRMAHRAEGRDAPARADGPAAVRRCRRRARHREPDRGAHPRRGPGGRGGGGHAAPEGEPGRRRRRARGRARWTGRRSSTRCSPPTGCCWGRARAATATTIARSSCWSGPCRRARASARTSCTRSAAPTSAPSSTRRRRSATWKAPRSRRRRRCAATSSTTRRAARSSPATTRARSGTSPTPSGPAARRPARRRR